MPMSYTTNTCVSCIHVSISKVDYTMANTFMYVVVTLNFNKVMPRGVHCIKHVRVYVSAQKGY